ncbi:acetate--CoA ligase [Pseudidiomarina sp. 1APP75-32.1]|uniref:Acetate--CoA ligase n=1 Tax=Pseudidiomarina terrestris TaxID=2820060 RepID=A0AAW7QWW4_9GAMM|nr:MULTISPECIES: acetate--CoA ligase [unclassified Pseudidiomarina]MDN7124646.1 acetate--CoA ligase [Pseudidiomarina sp. 1APP75-32.1]MDN7129063.1 acetate--CoA ligase [Pseudidiomarina sp. 1APR75-15]
MNNYPHEYELSLQQPEKFWLQQAKQLHWFAEPQQGLRPNENGTADWFVDGELNIAFCALDFHVDNGRGDQLALIYDSPVTATKSTYTYRQLRDEVAQFAGLLKKQHVKKGDRVVIYMPMIPQAAIAMLACARLGAVHSVVFGGFAPHELAVRIDDATPKVVITASCGVEVDKVIPYKPYVDEALELAAAPPQHVIVWQREICEARLQEPRDIDWQQALAGVTPAECAVMQATDPLYVLYTSGTTGKPKGVVRDTGGYAVALRYSMRTVYGIEPGQVMFVASDVGWVVGHSYIVYGPLLSGATTVLYEGKPVRTPDAGAFWRICEEYGVQVLFSAPTAFRAIKKEDPQATLLQQHSLDKLERIYMAGERLDPPTLEWTQEVTGKPVYDHWWQTESGWPMCANPVGIAEYPTKPGSATLPVPGYDIRILAPDGTELEANQQGAVAVKLPLPPGCLTTIWGDETRFQAGYLREFSGFYSSGDGGYKDDDGYVFIMGRTDDVINVAGHRFSTGEMEEILAMDPAVAECAVIGVADELKGQVPLGLVIVKDGVTIAPEVLSQRLVQRVRDEIGAVACLRQVHVVPRLPKTRSGKILRRLLRQLADGDSQVAIPSTIDDPGCVDELRQRLSD